MIKQILRKIKSCVFPSITEVDLLYRKKGVNIGINTTLYSVQLDACFPWLISIGKNCTITHSTVLAHDASCKNFLGYSKVARVEIGNDCFIGYNSTILLGVKIGDNVIIGAGSVVTKDIPSNSVAAGVPAKKICEYDKYVEKTKILFKKEDTYISNILFNQKRLKEKEKQRKRLGDGEIGFDL